MIEPGNRSDASALVIVRRLAIEDRMIEPGNSQRQARRPSPPDLAIEDRMIEPGNVPQLAHMKIEDTKEYRELYDSFKRVQERCNELLMERRGIRYLVSEFHLKFSRPFRKVPKVPSDDEVRFRLKMVAEEFMEFVKACLGPWKAAPWALEAAEKALLWAIHNCPIKVDMVEATDAMTDLDYVVEGSRLAFGIDGWPVLLEVHRANMEKDCEYLDKVDQAKNLGAIKIQKPPGWKPPNIEMVLVQQGWDRKNEHNPSDT